MIAAFLIAQMCEGSPEDYSLIAQMCEGNPEDNSLIAQTSESLASEYQSRGFDFLFP